MSSYIHSGRELDPVTPDDPRYAALMDRGYNHRSRAMPERISLVTTTDDVVRAVDEALQADRRIGVRSGGHCLETLLDDVGHLIDFTQMRRISYDRAHGAIAIEPGATMGQIYRTLHDTWGVSVPGGDCNAVAAGGHIPGNGFGTMARRDGLIADHLYAVEVVVVGNDGVPRAVSVTREEDDPNRDLWWAHVGGGGGTFGIATRFWLRSPGAMTNDPTRILPRAPRAQVATQMVWNWSDIDETALARLAANFGVWCEENSLPGSAGKQLYATLSMRRVDARQMRVVAFTGPSEPGSEEVLAGFLSEVSAGLPTATQTASSAPRAWLTAALAFPDSSVAQGVTGPPRWKSKIAILNRRYTDDQIAVAYDHLTRQDYASPSSGFSLTTYGGQINALSQEETAFAHRAGVILAGFYSVWDAAAEDEEHLSWCRSIYRDVHRASGGVPVPDGRTDGIAPNWPDLDLLDPVWNESQLGPGDLYFKENLPRLRRVKAAWDPLGVFRHPLSVLPEPASVPEQWKQSEK